MKNQFTQMLLRMRKHDPDTFKQTCQAFEAMYAERLDQLVGAQPESLPCAQGACRAYKDLLGIFKEVLRSS